MDTTKGWQGNWKVELFLNFLKYAGIATLIVECILAGFWVLIILTLNFLLGIDIFTIALWGWAITSTLIGGLVWVVIYLEYRLEKSGLECFEANKDEIIRFLTEES